MTPTERLLLIGGILLTVVVSYAIVYRRDLISKSYFLDKKLLERGMDKPVLWLFYNQSDVNSRNWLDFGNRSSHALSIPVLNLLYGLLVECNKEHYRVEVIHGLTGVAELLGGWDALPPCMRDPIAPVGTAEQNFIRAAILAKKGGLWVNPYTIAIRPFGKQPDKKVVFFGTDPNETYSGQKGTLIPGLHAMWSPYPTHPLFEEWAAVCYARVNDKKGGEQFRNDASWDYVRFSDQYKHLGIVVDPHAEGSRTTQGKRVQLEDLLAPTIDGQLPFEFSSESALVYVPLPYEELRDRKNYQWFLRSSEKQIMESDLVVTALIKRSLIRE